MNKSNLIILGLLFFFTTAFYSCDKEDESDNETYSISGTTWIYADEDDGGSNTFVFTDELSASFTQDWIDTGVDYTETKDGSYVYNHPSVKITIGSKEYVGTIDGETMNIGGFIYHKQ